jgi:hypothetical protein
MAREQVSAKKAWPAILAHYGDRIELANLDSMRGYVIQRILERLEVASWQTLQLVIEVVEGGTAGPAVVAAAGGKWWRLSRFVARLGGGMRRFGRVARATRVAPWLPARIAWLWAKRQALQAAIWVLVAYVAAVAGLAERLRRNKVANSSRGKRSHQHLKGGTFARQCEREKVRMEGRLNG